MVGLKAEFKDVFGEFSAEKTKISLSNDEEVEALREACPDDSKDVFDSLCGVYAARPFVLCLGRNYFREHGRKI